MSWRFRHIQPTLSQIRQAKYLIISIFFCKFYLIKKIFLHFKFYTEMQVEQIAMMAHQANKTWCELNNDLSQKDWDEAEQWQRDSAIKGVKFRLDNPTAGHDAQHNSWMSEKNGDGWVYGEIKNAETKTHPCIVPFEQLPEFQQKKDALFCAIVDALK